jgi:antitoxin PrlF
MEVLEIEAAVTERGQTTVPAAIRKALRVGKRGTVVFRLSDDGQVTLTRKIESEPDPVVGTFLAFMAKDMMANPNRLRYVTADWLAETRELVAGVAYDIEQPLSDDDA